MCGVGKPSDALDSDDAEHKTAEAKIDIDKLCLAVRRFRTMWQTRKWFHKDRINQPSELCLRTACVWPTLLASMMGFHIGCSPHANIRPTVSIDMNDESAETEFVELSVSDLKEMGVDCDSEELAALLAESAPMAERRPSESRARAKVESETAKFQRHPTQEVLLAIRDKLEPQVFFELYPGATPDKNQYTYTDKKRGHVSVYNYPLAKLLIVAKNGDSSLKERLRIDAGAGPMVISSTARDARDVWVPHPDSGLARPTQPGLYTLASMRHSANKQGKLGEYQWPLLPTKLTNNGSYLIHTRPNSEARYVEYRSCAAGCSGSSECIDSCDQRFPRILATSHGCVRVDPRDRNRLLDMGFLRREADKRQKQRMLIYLYTELPPPEPTQTPANTT